MTPDEVFTLLVVEAGANERFRDDFVQYLASDTSSHEYRFMGDLGFGGKLYQQHGRYWISCYREDETPRRLEIIAKVNAILDGSCTSQSP